MLQFLNRANKKSISPLRLTIFLLICLVGLVLLSMPYLDTLDTCVPNADGTCDIVEHGREIFSVLLYSAIAISLLSGFVCFVYQFQRR